MQHNLPKLFPLLTSVLPASFKAFSHKREISLFPSTVKCFSNGCVSRIGKPTSICKFISNERGKPSKASNDSVEWCDDCDVSRQWWLEMMMWWWWWTCFPGNTITTATATQYINHEVIVFVTLPVTPGAFISPKTTLLRARPNPRWRMKAKTSAAKLMEICLSEM